MSETVSKPLTYHPVDIADFLSLTDTRAVGYERLVRSLRQATAGVEGGKAMALAVVADSQLRFGHDPCEFDMDVVRWWEEGAPADDLRQIAREEAERYRDMAFDFRLSDNHPDRIKLTAGQWEELADDLTAWADKPRRDFLEICTEECEAKPWPVKLVYEQKHGAKNARLFLGQRPARIISSDGKPYSFEAGAWAETSDDRLEAEARATDPSDVLDVDHVKKLVRGVHHLTAVKARPFEWLDPSGNEPSPEHLALFGSDFGMQGFLDKRLVIVPDAHDAPTRNRAAALERIKSITGGDEVSVNRKNLAMLSVELKARILITCNRLPKFIDESGALAARMLIVRFDRSFRGREDWRMGARLKGEMSGIANWALEGLVRLRENAFRFSEGERGRAEVEDAARSHSPALRFAEARLTVTGDDEDFTPLAEVYQAYREWAVDEGLKGNELRSQTDLAHDIRAAVPSVRYTQRRRDRKQMYGLSGVSHAESEMLDEF